jgi:hypothetical protein
VLISEADGHLVWKYDMAMAFGHDHVERHGFHAGRIPYRHRWDQTSLTSRFLGQPGRSRCSAITVSIQKLNLGVDAEMTSAMASGCLSAGIWFTRAGPDCQTPA